MIAMIFQVKHAFGYKYKCHLPFSPMFCHLALIINTTNCNNLINMQGTNIFDKEMKKKIQCVKRSKVYCPLN